MEGAPDVLFWPLHVYMWWCLYMYTHIIPIIDMHMQKKFSDLN